MLFLNFRFWPEGNLYFPLPPLSAAIKSYIQPLIVSNIKLKTFQSIGKMSAGKTTTICTNKLEINSNGFHKYGKYACICVSILCFSCSLSKYISNLNMFYGLFTLLFPYPLYDQFFTLLQFIMPLNTHFNMSVHYFVSTDKQCCLLHE